MKVGFYMSDRVNWDELKNEYINTNISQRELAKKYGVSATAVANKCKVQKWVEQKEKQLSKTCAKVEQKTAEKIAERKSEEVAKNYDLFGLLQEKLMEELRAIKPNEPNKKIRWTDEDGIMHEEMYESSAKHLATIVSALSKIDERQSAKQELTAGVSRESVESVVNMVNEFKRRRTEGSS